MFNQILFLGLTYAISAIPFGLVLARIFTKTDIRQSGSKNIGATNVARVLGKKLGFATLVLDGLKGALMVIIARFQFVGTDNLHLFLVLVSAVAVLGHIFPIYLRFKGGKGVATTIAVLFALDLRIGFSVAVVWAVCFILMRISSVSSLSAVFSAIIFSFFYKSSLEQIILCCFLFLLVLIRHKENIIRLVSGEEKKIS